MSKSIKTECTFEVKTSRLWNAITHPEEMRKWFFGSMHSFIPQVGFNTRFNVVREGRNYIHIWKVTEVIPGHKISYEWRYGNHKGYSTVSFEVISANKKAILIVQHAGIKTFMHDNPEFTKEKFTDGWNYFICKSLKGYLALHPALKYQPNDSLPDSDNLLM